jgi:hypothetical protein
MTDLITIERVANGWLVRPPINYACGCAGDSLKMHVYTSIGDLMMALPELLGCTGGSLGVPRVQT